MSISAQLLPFLAIAVLLTIAPGPDNLMVLGIGASRGRRAGVAFGLGCALGCLGHTLLAALGASALLAASPLAFTMLTTLGGVYLIWLGVNAFQQARRSDPQKASVAADESFKKLFVQGLAANAINPKVALFFLSLLPQFVDASRGDIGLQTIILGIVFTAQAALLFSLIASCSATLGRWLSQHLSADRWLHALAGLVFFALGIRMIMAI